MIVVDTSAFLAIVLGEPEGRQCFDALTVADGIAISAGTLAEALIVSGRRGAAERLKTLTANLGTEVVPVTEDMARQVADAYTRWGKGIHPARLNFGDCFAYALAIERACPLLFIGGDFARTDVVSALDQS
jgi:ribonuclease VapC